MSLPFTLEFLGSGTSTGVPALACDCAVCKSLDPRNKRLRPSALFRIGETTLVVDTGPDFRQQMLRADVRRLDAVLITHYHVDHVVGIDDVRRYNFLQQTPLDCWGDAATLEKLKAGFGYAFSDTLRPGLPNLRPKVIEPGQPFRIGALFIRPVALDHHVIPNVGLLIQRGDADPQALRGHGPVLAYCVDTKRIPEATYEALAGVDTLVLDMLREQPHPTHMTRAEALAAVERIRPRRALFSHMGHEVDHGPFEAQLPPPVRLAFDGMLVEMPG